MLSLRRASSRQGILSHASNHNFCRMSDERTPGDMRRFVVWFAILAQTRCKRTSGNSRASAAPGEQSLLGRVASQFGIRCASNDRSRSRLLQIIAQAERAARQYTSRISRTDRGTCTKRRRQNLVERIGCTWRTKVILWPPGRGCWRH